MSTERAAAGSGSLLQLLLARAREATRPAATHRVEGRWRDVSWGEVLAGVRLLSAGLVAQGVTQRARPTPRSRPSP